MSVSSSGLITGTLSNDDVGGHSVTVLVRDSAGAIDQKTFNLTVNNLNDAPVFNFSHHRAPMRMLGLVTS